MANPFEDILKEKLAKAVKGLPLVLGNEAVNHSLDAFKQQGWDGNAWAKRKGNKNQARAILVQSGRGRRSIRVLEVGANRVVYGTDVPYMRAHNEGFQGTVSVKGYTRNKYGKGKVTSIHERTKAGNRKTKTVSFVAGQVQVKAHSRKVNLPRRQFADTGPVHSQKLINRLIEAGKAHIFKQLR